MNGLVETCAVLIILMDCVLMFPLPQEGTGQKAHFSLKDTPGSFTVNANKMLATVSSKPDSINVVVKPGTAEIPAPTSPTPKPLVHIVSPAVIQPVGGWNYMSLGKRSRIQKMNSSLRDNQKTSACGKSYSESVKSDEKRTKQGNKDLDCGRKRFRKRAKFFRGLRRHANARNVESDKKREIVERKMNVHSGAGKFSVHVDSKQANVSSATGALKVFIKNPSHSQLPEDMLKLPGVMVELPRGMSPVLQMNKGVSQLEESDLVKLPYDWTGASITDNKE